MLAQHMYVIIAHYNRSRMLMNFYLIQFYSQTHHSTPHSVHSLPHSRDFIRDNKDYYYREKDRDSRREHFRDHRGPTRYIHRSRKSTNSNKLFQLTRKKLIKNLPHLQWNTMTQITTCDMNTETENENCTNWNEIVRENWSAKGKQFEFRYVCSFVSHIFSQFVSSNSLFNHSICE